MPKLNDSQLIILTAAAQRDNRLVLPLSTSLDLDETGAESMIKKLIKTKLIVARPARRGEPQWRAGSRDARQTLVITDAGRKAVGIAEEEGETSPTVGEEAQSQKSRSKGRARARALREAALGSQPASIATVSGPRNKRSRQKAVKTAGDESQENWSAKQEGGAKRPGKVDQILVLLKRPEGASIEDLTAATG